MIASQAISSFIEKISKDFNKLDLKNIDQNIACAYFYKDYKDSLVFDNINFCIGTHLAIIFDKVNKTYKKDSEFLYGNPSKFIRFKNNINVFSWHDGILESCKFLNVEPSQLYMLFHACGTPFNPFTETPWKKQPKEVLENMKLIESFPPKMNFNIDCLAEIYPIRYITYYNEENEYYVRQICIFEKLFGGIKEKTCYDVLDIENIILNIEEINNWLYKYLWILRL